MAEKNLGAMYVTQLDNVGWISGFTGSNGYVLITPTGAFFATDSRYTLQAATECQGFKIVNLGANAADDLIQMIVQSGAKQVGFEASHLTFRSHEATRAKLPAEIELVSTDRLIDDLRLVKDDGEITLIKTSCRLADRAFEHILPFIHPGATERDIMLELEWYMRKQGGAEIAFDSIVVSGPRTALPHGKATSRVLENGDLVTLDFGSRLERYCSDITRTVVLGTPTERQKLIYNTVLEAQTKAIAAIKPGANGKDIDAIARNHITAAGFGDYFGHGLGHSIGRVVHDGPGFSSRSDIVLAPGMVMTVEPGIYIPGWGGVRIEHDVLVTETGNSVLTHSTTELLSLPTVKRTISEQA